MIMVFAELSNFSVRAPGNVIAEQPIDCRVAVIDALVTTEILVVAAKYPLENPLQLICVVSTGHQLNVPSGVAAPVTRTLLPGSSRHLCDAPVDPDALIALPVDSEVARKSPTTIASAFCDKAPATKSVSMSKQPRANRNIAEFMLPPNGCLFRIETCRLIDLAQFIAVGDVRQQHSVSGQARKGNRYQTPPRRVGFDCDAP